MLLLEPLEGRERLGDSAQVPLAHRDQIQNVAVFGHLGGQRLGRPQALGVLSALEELSYPVNFQFYRGRGWIGGGRVHHSPLTKKAGIAARP